VASLLVLWDVDHTLINAGGVGIQVYEQAFRELYSLEVPSVRVNMAGRTDRAIAIEMLTMAGLADPHDRVTEFQAVQAAHAPTLAAEFAAKGRVLPGVREVIAALAADPRPGLRIIQSLLTGNVRELADVKLGSLGLTEHLDLDAGAYGTESEIRAELVPVARRNAARRYGEDFSGPATVLVGDTPLDVEAALVTGARAVGVATGGFTVEELLAAGAHAALPDLSDTTLALDAILGPP
jgi:phosphoglycolate phosphatase